MKRFVRVAMIAPLGLTVGAAATHGQSVALEDPAAGTRGAAAAARQPETQAAEDARQARQRRRKLEGLMERIGDPESPWRGGDSAALALLAGAEPELDPDVGRFAYWMKRDEDPEVARWGEILAARFEERAPDSELVPPPPLSAVRLRRECERDRVDALLEQATDVEPLRRLQALQDLAELTSSRGDRWDRELEDALRSAVTDPDSRVSAFARFTLKGLAGDRNALGMVHVALPAGQ